MFRLRNEKIKSYTRLFVCMTPDLNFSCETSSVHLKSLGLNVIRAVVRENQGFAKTKAHTSTFVILLLESSVCKTFYKQKFTILERLCS